jgi:RNA polymerase sigma-70 factor (ECF subfamily)
VTRHRSASSTGTLPGESGSGYLAHMAPQSLLEDPPGPRLRLVAGKGPSSTSNVQPIRPEQDEDLALAFQSGQPGAGIRLYDRLFPVVDATIVRILGRREHDHPDLVQSTFEQIVTTLSRRTFGRECSLAGWAAVLACHVGLNALRSRRRERGVIDRGPRIGAQDTLEHAVPTSLESQLGARDELARVRRHLAEMDPDRVTAMLLSAMGYDLAAVASLTGKSVAAAQSRLSRGRRELRDRLEETPAGPTNDPRKP